VSAGGSISETGGLPSSVRNAAIDSLTEPPRPLVFQPWTQRVSSVLTLHVRTSTDPMGLVEPVRRALAGVHGDLAALDPGTLADHMLAATFVQSVGASVFTAFGLIAIVIAAIGLHGVVAQFVAEHRREIAVTVALGATSATVARSVIGPALRLTLYGLTLGAALASAVSWFVQSQLIGIAPIDVATVVVAMLLLASASLASSFVPAWRAVRLDPVAAIRGV
jgi:putative ABC transport system permease protein